ncbi:MAG: heparinase II/III family protein [Victivallales bacterium]|nr:heparinase II/III family protein [Victivallales bacterium]
MKFRICTSFLLLCVGLLAAPKKNPWPLYRDQRVPRPEGLRTFQAKEFQPNVEFASKMPSNSILSPEVIAEMAKFYRDDSDGQERWQGAGKRLAELLNTYDFKTGGGSGANACYIVRLYNGARFFAKMYRLTGCREVGQFLRAHFLLACSLPMDFWIHAELRNYNPERPVGGLETGHCAGNLSFALAMTGPEIFSPEEYQLVLKTLRENCLVPCLRWLEDHKTAQNNWVSSIASNTYVCARFLGDKDAMAIARAHLKRFAENSFEPDGSYGEGPSYMTYPLSCLVVPMRLMSKEEAQETFGASSMRKCAEWLASCYFYQRNEKGNAVPTLVHFGDNPYWNAPRVLTELAEFYQDGLSSWLLSHFGIRPDHWNAFPPRLNDYQLPAPVSPEQLKLPLVRAFDNGWGILRSTWKDCGIVLGIKSGSAARINYAHQRPELNSIAMAAYNEYFIVCCGSASYRAELHKNYDLQSISANLVTVDGKGQLSRRNAKILLAEEGNLARWLTSEAREAYEVPLKSARRSLAFVKEPGYFVMVDRFLPMDAKPHQYLSRLHFNNRDEQAVVKQLQEGLWSCKRPNATLYIYTVSSEALAFRQGQGYMHGAGRDYSPGGIFEGKLGSAITLEASNSNPAGNITFSTILFPVRKGDTPPAISGSWNKLQVGNDTILVQDDTITIQQGSLRETK